MNDAEVTKEYWAAVVRVLADIPVRCRVHVIDGTEPQWARLVFSPSSGYLEMAGLGPIPVREVAWIEVESSEQRHRGRLVPDLAVDHSQALLSAFRQHRLHFETTPHGYRIVASHVGS